MTYRTFGLTLLGAAFAVVTGLNSLMLVTALSVVGVLALVKGNDRAGR